MNNRKATQQTSSSYPANSFVHRGDGLPQSAIAVQIESAGALKLSEEQFYSLYHWSLNPALTIQDLLQRFREELDRFPALEIGWQREECKINLYLFACAIASSIDHCLAEACGDITIDSVLPPSSHLRSILQSSAERVHSLRKLVRDTGLRTWRKNWTACVDRSCELLLSPPTEAQEIVGTFRHLAMRLLRDALPPRVLGYQALLPRCFRSGDVTHYDVLSLAQSFDEVIAPHSPLLVIGVGPAGAFFAPLITASLKVLKWRHVSWMTLAASDTIEGWKEHQPLKRLQRGLRVLLTPGDFDPAISVAPTIEMLQRIGVPPENVTIAGAKLSGQSVSADIKADRIQVIPLEPDSLHKRRLLDPKSMQYLIAEYFAANGWQQAAITVSRASGNTNGRAPGTNKWQRLEQIFSVHLGGTTKKSVMRDVSVTSAGWGWLGYHSYIAAARLNGFVPKPLGLRDGFLFTECCSGEPPAHDPQPPEAMPKLISSYVAARVRRLRLESDASLRINNNRNGWSELAEMLSRCYHPAMQRLKRRELRERLRSYAGSVPTLVDDNIGPEQWVRCEGSLRKTGFDYYCRDPEISITDPAWDLAAATFECSMTPDQEQEMLQGYTQETGDTSVGRRILLYKLLYGARVMRRAADAIAQWHSSKEHARMRLVQARASDHLDKCESWNRRFQEARDFLVFQMSRFSGGLVQVSQNATWSKFLFFLDMDGVFDCELLGFPHTTWSGLEALIRLQSHAYSVVLNASRSIRHVRNYCESFGIPGGIAEYGSVFFDAVRRYEIPLIDARAATQLAACRQALGALPGVFIDPGYQYAIRAYRYHGQHTVGIPLDELTLRWNTSAFDRLTLILKPTETYVIAKGAGKGPASVEVRKLLGLADAPTAAVGDSGEDAGMLEAAQFAYAPANCSLSIRQLAIQGKCRIMRHAFQRGLLEAVVETLPAGHKSCNATRARVHDIDSPAGLISALLDIADRSLISQLSGRVG
ncbi:MAG: hypothetical protein HYX72_06605 [Acidobacteria bacterium]|nr:hypothetical protein [Acidobacteriota bacterium]